MKKSKNRKNWIIASISLATVLPISGSDLVHLYYVSANWDSIYQVAEKLTILNADKGYRALAWLHWTDKIGGEINKHKDYSKAEYYALQVADKDMFSCFYLGWMCDEGGFGIKKDCTFKIEMHNFILSA